MLGPLNRRCLFDGGQYNKKIKKPLSVTPAKMSGDETVSTLTFASNAKIIRLKAQVNRCLMTMPRSRDLGLSCPSSRRSVLYFWYVVKIVRRYNFCTSCLGSENMVVVHCVLMFVKTTKEAQESYRGERVILISQEKVVQEAERKS